ncbi:MAG: RHS repeat-associated core domain-containing protein [Prosthecobacter sp.]
MRPQLPIRRVQPREAELDDSRPFGSYQDRYSQRQTLAFRLGNETCLGTMSLVLTPLRHRNLGGWLCLLAFVLHLTGESVQASQHTGGFRAVENATGGTSWIMSQASYNDLGLPTGTTDPEGREQKIEYYMAADGTQYADNQDVRYAKVKNGASWQTMLTISQYKVIGGKSVHLPEVMTDASGVQTTMAYNDKGQVASVTLSKGAGTETTNLIYDNNLDGTPDADGYLLRVEHTSPVNPAQFVTLETRTYDAAKRVRTVTDTEGYTLTFDYDNLDRVTLVTHPDSTTEQMVYADGTKQTLDVWASKDRAGHWSRTRYNHLRQPVMQLDSLARLTQWEWCKCGSLSKLIDAQNKTTFWKRDMQGRVTEKVLPDTKKFVYTYQPLSGRPATVSMPQDVLNNQTTSTNVYYLGGQLQTLNYTAATMADVSYGAADVFGRPTTVTDGTGTTTMSYVPFTGTPNAAGQVATVNGSLTNDTRRYSYDWQGRATKQEIVNDDGVTVTRTQEITGRDTLGRATGLVNNLGTFTPTYNTGNLTGMADSVALPGGFSTVMTRYGAGAGANALRLQGIEHKQGTSTVQKHDYAYNLSGNLTTWNRTNAASVVNAWTMRHDSGDQLTDLEETIGGTPSRTESWHYDKAGNLASTQVQPAGQSAILRMRQHTGRNQLTSFGGSGKTLVEGTVDEAATVMVNGQPAAVNKLGPSGPWRYQREVDFPDGQTSIAIVATDGSSNVTTKNYSVTVNAAAGARTLEYDTNGNLTKQRNAANVVTRLCEWDAVNQLKAVQSAETLVAGVKRSEFTYDGGGRRVRQIEKEHNGTTWTTVSDWRYIWDGLELAQKRDATTNALLTNYFGNGEQQGSDSIVYQTDHLGSPRSWYRVSDGSRGEADYTAYGERSVTSAGPGVPERSFTGHLHHAASGLVLAPFRAYDADLGRWISEDPIGESGGMNLYSYLGGDVVGSVDPLGLFKMNWGRFGWGLAKGAYWGVVGLAAATAAVAFLPAMAVGALAVGAVALTGYAAVKTYQSWHCLSDGDKSELAGDLIGGVLGGGAGGLFKGRSQVTMFRRGSPSETTAPMDWAMMSDEARITLTVERYGFNFNKGQVVRAGGDLGTDIFGKTVSTSPRTLWVSNLALRSEEELAITIGHELRHSRAFLGSGANTEEAAIASQEALRAFIQGNR